MVSRKVANVSPDPFSTVGILPLVLSFFLQPQTRGFTFAHEQYEDLLVWGDFERRGLCQGCLTGEVLSVDFTPPFTFPCVCLGFHHGSVQTSASN